ncbi:Rossmann-like domain-containing protein [Sulfurospirillum arcachonense]|uniref:Rossmann-like domain-containing protein n=1 Tax=Sulfurospirillum arcachonense TaxID=57666 RepID=UPI0004685121|nr:DUF364 domain-containing protein [Sulfurospirillum arcachonense]
MLFYKLQENALRCIEENSLQFVESGMGALFTYTKITDGLNEATGVCLTPKTEGAIGRFCPGDLKNLLIQGNVYDAGKRAFSLSTMNAISQYLLSKEKLKLEEDLRDNLTKFILKNSHENSKIIFIGHLQPVVKALKEKRKNISVFCRQHTDVENKIYNDIYEYEAISQADILIITGATLLGSTIDAILHFSKNVPIKVITGFSAGTYPSWFKDSGLTHVASLYLKNINHSTLLHNNLNEIFTYPCYISKI